MKVQPVFGMAFEPLQGRTRIPWDSSLPAHSPHEGVFLGLDDLSAFSASALAAKQMSEPPQKPVSLKRKLLGYFA